MRCSVRDSCSPFHSLTAFQNAWGRNAITEIQKGSESWVPLHRLLEPVCCTVRQAFSLCNLYKTKCWCSGMTSLLKLLIDEQISGICSTRTRIILNLEGNAPKVEYFSFISNACSLVGIAQYAGWTPCFRPPPIHRQPEKFHP